MHESVTCAKMVFTILVYHQIREKEWKVTADDHSFFLKLSRCEKTFVASRWDSRHLQISLPIYPGRPCDHEASEMMLVPQLYCDPEK